MGIRNSTKSFSAPAPQPESELHDAPGLEFPDWNGMAERESRMSFAEAVRWNEAMLATFPPKPNRAELDADAKCVAEFVL